MINGAESITKVLETGSDFGFKKAIIIASLHFYRFGIFICRHNKHDFCIGPVCPNTDAVLTISRRFFCMWTEHGRGVVVLAIDNAGDVFFAGSVLHHLTSLLKIRIFLLCVFLGSRYSSQSSAGSIEALIEPLQCGMRQSAP